jgi:hypothetical protein
MHCNHCFVEKSPSITDKSIEVWYCESCIYSAMRTEEERFKRMVGHEFAWHYPVCSWNNATCKCSLLPPHNKEKHNEVACQFCGQDHYDEQCPDKNKMFKGKLQVSKFAVCIGNGINDILWHTPKQICDMYNRTLECGFCGNAWIRFNVIKGYYVFYCNSCGRKLAWKKKIIGKPQNRQFIRDDKVYQGDSND